MQPSDSQQPETWQQPEAPLADEYHPVTQQNAAPEYQAAQTEEVDEPTLAPDGDEELLRWQAAEYIHRDRTTLWYVILAIIVVALIVVAIFVIKSFTFAILIPVMAAALIVYTRRPPVMVQYILSRKGVHVNDKLYGYALFRAFSILSHDGHHSIVLIPRKRFAMAETLYFPEELGETIVDMLAARLPIKDAKPDIFDRIITKLKM